MSRQVLFNGATLVRAGGASFVNTNAFQSSNIAGLGAVGLVGEADGGLPNQVLAFTSAQQMVNYFRSGPLADAAALAFSPSSDPRVPGGAQVVYACKANQSTQAIATLTKSSVAAMTLTSNDAGVHTNKIQYQVVTVSGGKTVEIQFVDGSNITTINSPVLGATPELTIQYTGSGTACTMSVTATGLTTTVTGAAGDSLNLTWSSFTCLNDVVNFLNATGKYTAVASGTNPYAFQPTNLDYVTSVDIKTAAYQAFAKLFRMIDWINSNQTLVTAARVAGATGAPDDVATLTNLTGGARGISANSNWQACFNALGAVNANETVPLCSYDLSTDGLGSTATFASVSAMSDQHATYYSSTIGKSERQNYIGQNGTKTQLLATAAGLQSPHSVLTGSYVTRANAQGTITQFPAWGHAVILAGIRAGSVLGEPATYKNFIASGVTQDASWNPLNDGASMILGGVTFAFSPQGGGYKTDRVRTTYTKTDNDALAEESIVTTWKTISYNLRTQIEATFTGTRAVLPTVRGILDLAGAILEQYRQQQAIVDSTLPDGTTQKAYRDLKVNVQNDTSNLVATISPVAGINFTLETLNLVQATLSA